MTLKEIVEQLESCDYRCEAGSLENNVAFQELKRLAEKPARMPSIRVRHLDRAGIPIPRVDAVATKTVKLPKRGDTFGECVSAPPNDECESV